MLITAHHAEVGNLGSQSCLVPSSNDNDVARCRAPRGPSLGVHVAQSACGLVRESARGTTLRLHY